MISTIVIGVIGSLIAAELTDVSAWCAVRLARWSAFSVHAGNPARAEQRAEEWEALIDDEIPGGLLKLGFASGFACRAIAACGARVVARIVFQRGQSGFRVSTLHLHALPLLLAAGADVSAFVPTAQMALPEQADWIVWLIVCGLTAVVLYIADMVGLLFSEANADRGMANRPCKASGRFARRGAAFTASLVWLAVGLLASWARYKVQFSTQIGRCGSVIGSGCSTTSASPGHSLQAAAIFLGLYLAAGMVAALTAYVLDCDRKLSAARRRRILQ